MWHCNGIFDVVMVRVGRMGIYEERQNISSRELCCSLRVKTMKQLEYEGGGADV